MEPRGRGRAARGGRGRSDSNTQQPTRPGPAPQGAWMRQQNPSQQRPQGPPQQRPQGPPQQRQGPPQPRQQGPQSQRPQGPSYQGAPQQSRPQTAEGAWGRQPQTAAPDAPQAQGRGIRVEQGVVSEGGDHQVRDARERGGGNGGVRGRSNRTEVIHTKPSHVVKKQGTAGSVIKLTANYFKLLNKPDWALHQYRVDFNPDVDDTKVRRNLVYNGFKKIDDIGGFLFDGTVIYTASRLNPDPIVRTAQHETAGIVTMTAKWVSQLAWGDYHYIQVFNLLIRKCMILMKLQLVGRNYYDVEAQVNITDHKMYLWPGYLTSIRQHEQEILMNTELTFKVMRTDNVYDLLLNTVDRSGRTDTNAFMKKVIGNVVLTFYNNKTYRIDDVDFQASPRSTFKTSSGEEISYIDYYKQRYAVNIQVHNQPLLISRPKAREIRAGMPEILYLVPELCQMTGLSDEQRQNFQLMSAMAQHTRVGPQSRQQKLLQFIAKLKSNKEIMTEIKRWDMNIADRLVELDGRVLGQEEIKAGQDIKFRSGPKADWTMNLRSNPMIFSGNMERIAVITLSNMRSDVDNFMSMIGRAASGMRWNTNNYKLFTIDQDRISDYLDKIEEVVNSAHPTLVMAFLNRRNNDRYCAIKKKCCVDKGVPSQVVTAKCYRNPKGAMSIATKVAIQMNCKIGGAPWAVSIPVKGGVMVVGYDVCRDTANRSKSFGGMVASIDPLCTRYYSSVSEHKMEEELSDNFASFMLIACQKYRENNGEFPKNIIIYRDGVGDGQIPQVLDHEVKNIRQKLESEIYKNELKLAFVIVSKRINTRIFNGDQNPPPGTVVDDVITLPERYDYFIVSQCVNQGTVAPTSYNVISDTMGLKPDYMQILTYKLCHTYYNWSGTIRVPAPCQYAHKLAFLTAQSLHRAAHRRLDTVLYFL